MDYGKLDLVTRACIFAYRNHCGQTRYNKTKSPMMDHVSEVAGLVREAGGSDLEISAAWLHDTVEDTSVTIEEIALIFGSEVAGIVDGLTDPPEFHDKHTFERKVFQAQRIIDKSDSVKLVKIADQISNVQAVAVDPPVKWDHKKCLDYVEGARMIVEECARVSEYLYGKFLRAYYLAVEAHQ